MVSTHVNSDQMTNSDTQTRFCTTVRSNLRRSRTSISNKSRETFFSRSTSIFWPPLKNNQWQRRRWSANRPSCSRPLDNDDAAPRGMYNGRPHRMRAGTDHLDGLWALIQNDHHPSITTIIRLSNAAIYHPDSCRRNGNLASHLSILRLTNR